MDKDILYLVLVIVFIDIGIIIRYVIFLTFIYIINIRQEFFSTMHVIWGKNIKMTINTQILFFLKFTSANTTPVAHAVGKVFALQREIGFDKLKQVVIAPIHCQTFGNSCECHRYSKMTIRNKFLESGVAR